MDDEELDQLAEEWVFVRSTVEMGLDTDTEWFTYPRAAWEALSAGERDKIRVEYAVTHQSNVAPCGASEAESLDDVPDDVLDDPAGYQL
jgi:hypothetical protein